MSGNLAAVKYALSISPSIKVTKKDGTSVMHLAVAVANRGVAEAKTSIADAKVLIQYLADNGADLTAKNARGQTPADTAGRADPEIQEFYGKLLKARGTQVVEDKLKPASPS